MMGANVKVRIESPHGGKTRMDLNPDQVKWLVCALDTSSTPDQQFTRWFIGNIRPHSDERPRR